MTMGYFTREDLPFYYALADAFTICDGYHASIFGPTNPNRMFLFSGTSGLAVGDDSPVVIANLDQEPSERADPARDNPKFKGLAWPTYAERLQKAGVSWKLYQEYDNFGDNGLAFFANFRGIGPDSALYQRGRAWAPGSGPDNYKTSRGEYLVDQFAADVKAGTLPQVSWIVAPYVLSEHPEASPAQGEYFTARLIAALAANPELWSKTAFILNYDENDGFFDHMPPNIPTAGPALGKSTVEATGEVYHGEPVGYGPRVPLIVVSPWTKGGWVNSQRFDHTSVLRFLEARFGVEEPHITPWRRAVSGDLTSVFDFAGTAAPVKSLPDASGLPAIAEAGRKRPWPRPPQTPRTDAAPGGWRPPRPRPALRLRGRLAGQDRRGAPDHRQHRRGRRGLQPLSRRPWRAPVLYGRGRQVGGRRSAGGCGGLSCRAAWPERLSAHPARFQLARPDPRRGRGSTPSGAGWRSPCVTMGPRL